jgi:hypothetical protein
MNKISVEPLANTIKQMQDEQDLFDVRDQKDIDKMMQDITGKPIFNIDAREQSSNTRTKTSFNFEKAPERSAEEKSADEKAEPEEKAAEDGEPTDDAPADEARESTAKEDVTVVDGKAVETPSPVPKTVPEADGNEDTMEM